MLARQDTYFLLRKNEQLMEILGSVKAYSKFGAKLQLGTRARDGYYLANRLGFWKITGSMLPKVEPQMVILLLPVSTHEIGNILL